ncbi:heavy metal-binding domain-containing protein [Flaviaesturariibacter amylovorans]
MKCEGEKTYAKAGKCPECRMALAKVKKIAVAYQCPMKCEGEKSYTTDGRCPVCNMNLTRAETKKKG